MSCCDEYGACTQGPGCPARAVGCPPTRCEILGVCNAGPDCACEKDTVPEEAGNVWLAGYEPEDEKLNMFETIVIYVTLMILSIISLGLISAGAIAIFDYFFA